MTTTHLLAKSTEDENAPKAVERLQGHTAMVISASEKLVFLRGLASLSAVGLPAAWLPRLQKIVRLAAFIHDLGKCSDHFQAMVRGQRKEPQLIRHEALSLWLCWPGQPLSGWLQTAVDSDTDYRIAVIAAAAHHRKFWSYAFAPEGKGAGATITLLCGHPDFQQLLKTARTSFSLNPPPPIQNIKLEDGLRKSPRKEFQQWETQVKAAETTPEETRFLAVVKALIIAADVAGSALPKDGKKTVWVEEQLQPTEQIQSLRRNVVHARLAGNQLRPFQEEVGHSKSPITLVKAGCGTGKTLAACQWSAEQHPQRQLWLTYPTTGTATEGFRDYLQGAEIPARLDHGRAEVDVEIFGLRDGEDGPRDRDRLEALRNWGVDVVTCTVDTVLGLVQNQRKGLYAWPSLCQGAVVFDEVHAYDEQLFGCLLRFLEALPGIPVLLMTASLPLHRLQALEKLSIHIHQRPLLIINGPTELEELPRYQLLPEQNPWQRVEECLQIGGKVLWVSNTVDRCMETFARAPQFASRFVYHSRFKYEDRIERHRDVVDSFRHTGAVLASTTQVAEMSLDLSADLLVTDLAPIPSLIQRLGRLNRRSTPENPAPIKHVLVLPFAGLPYEQESLDEAREWLRRLEGRALSQRDLSEAWKQRSSENIEGIFSAWLDGVFLTSAHTVRDASPGVTVLLEEDLPLLQSGQKKLVEVALPMNPPPPKIKLKTQYKYYPVVTRADVSYDCKRGASWNK